MINNVVFYLQILSGRDVLEKSCPQNTNSELMLNVLQFITHFVVKNAEYQKRTNEQYDVTMLKLDCAQKSQTSASTYNLNQVNPGFESRFQINPDLDPDVCQIAPKLLWIHYLVGISYFGKCRENQPVTA